MKNLRQSVATLQICGEWGSANDDATLEMSTDRVWMQGRAPQKRLTALQASQALSTSASGRAQTKAALVLRGCSGSASKTA